MMYSAYKLSKQGDDIQPWCTPFPIWNQSIVPILTVTSWPAYRFHRRQVKKKIKKIKVGSSVSKINSHLLIVQPLEGWPETLSNSAEQRPALGSRYPLCAEHSVVPSCLVQKTPCLGTVTPRPSSDQCPSWAPENVPSVILERPCPVSRKHFFSSEGALHQPWPQLTPHPALSKARGAVHPCPQRPFGLWLWRARLTNVGKSTL